MPNKYWEFFIDNLLGKINLDGSYNDLAVTFYSFSEKGHFSIWSNNILTAYNSELANNWKV